MKLVKRCDCCNSQLDGLQCSRRGQRLRTLYKLACGRLRWGLAAAMEWNADFFEGDTSLADMAQGVIRAAFSLAMRKIGHLNKIPWLFARLAEPCVRDEVIAQFDSKPIARHHNLSVFLCKPGSSNRALLMQIEPDGSNVPALIQSVVDKMTNCNMDDTINETPHAEAKRKFENSSLLR
jgi:hypothetical protein